MGFFKFSWTSPLSPRPHWLADLLVGLHKVNHKVNHVVNDQVHTPQSDRKKYKERKNFIRTVRN